MSIAIEEPIRTVRSHLAEVVDRSVTTPTVITRNGKRVAAVVSVDVLQRYEELEEEYLTRIIDERMANPAPGIPIEDVMRETMARDEC